MNHLIFTGFAAGASLVTGVSLVNGPAATTAGTPTIINNAGALFYDADGAGSAGPVQFATLTGVSTLQPTDFVIL